MESSSWSASSLVVQCIGATTLDEYRKHIEKDPALERRFQPVKVPEPSVDETIQILQGLRERYEIHHKLRYTDEALVAAAQLSYQYIRFGGFKISSRYWKINSLLSLNPFRSESCTAFSYLAATRNLMWMKTNVQYAI